MAFFQNGHLRVDASNHFNNYQTSAKELHQFLYSLHQTQQDFRQWIDHTLEFYGFEDGYDFAIPNQTAGCSLDDGDEDDVILRLDTAKELARIARTERGREARYYLIEFEGQLHPQRAGQAVDKNIKQLNKLAHSMNIASSVVYITTADLTNLVQAVRQYQYIAELYLTPEHGIEPFWVNELIEKIQQETGTLTFYADEK